MQRRIGNLFNRGQRNRNDPPAVPGRAANNHPPQSDAAAARAPRSASPRQRHGWQRELQLRDLRIGDEPAHELVNVPALGRRGLRPIPIPADPESQHLTGRAYLEFLSTDARLFGAIKQLIASEHILAARPPLAPERIANMAERLRPVVAAIYHDSQRRDLTLARDVNRLALDVQDGCGDRLDYMLRQIEDVALLARLSRGDIDEVDLYNNGIAFFMLHNVIGETGREATLHNAASESQNVHAQLEAIYFLQDSLHLPHRQARPIYYGQDLSFMTERIARRIGDKVRHAATENDGERVIQFMSTWEPWVLHLQRNDKHRPDFEMLTTNYHNLLEAMARDRENPASPLHSSVMDPVTYQAEIGTVNCKRSENMSDYVGQLTRTFLVNHRADYLAEHGALPAYFN